MMFNKRAQYEGDTVVGYIRILWWWIAVKRFASMSDAVKWLGYGDEEE